MRENYNLDRLVDYSVNEIPDTTKVVCPLYREADRDVKRVASQLGRKRCECNEVVCVMILNQTRSCYALGSHTLTLFIRFVHATT